ncbi:hypothetical protein OAB00_02310 [Akkermansiaceae bacterium]|nr:hypothetical protein [Akkermansiaceae bacterium]
MNFLHIFGLASMLCTVAIIAYVWTISTEKSLNALNEFKANDLPQIENPPRFKDLEKLEKGLQALADRDYNIDNIPQTLTIAAEKELSGIPFGTDLKLKNIASLLKQYRFLAGEGFFPLENEKNSNQAFKRLLDTTSTESDNDFFLDGSFASLAEHKSNSIIMAKGKNHWAIIHAPKLKNSNSQNSQNSPVPFIIEPFRKYETSFRISDYTPDRGVLCLFSDGSLQNLKLNSDGKLLYLDKDILSGTHPVWNGHQPQILQPDF